MPNYSNIELDIINKNRKDEKDLPKYYSSRMKLEVPITRDFEAYLILQSQDHKQKTIGWIKRVQNISNNFKDRDAILSELLSNRKAQANFRIKELDSVLGNYDQFRTGILANPVSGDDSNKFAEVTEVTSLTQILQKPIDYMNLLRERAFHESVMVGIWENRIGIDGYTAEALQELASWETVISAYPGQSGSLQRSSGSDLSRTSL